MGIDDIISHMEHNLDNTLGHIMNALQFCPECGTRINADCCFCPTCGTQINEAKDSTFSSNGILFTNTQTLAEKYGCTRQDVLDMFDHIVELSYECNIHWNLLDVADESLDDFWLNYNEKISNYLQEENLPYGMNTHIFIIGGDDVIPIPMVEDPFGSSDNGRIPCDMCYCFTGNFFSDMWDGEHIITENYVRNTIARLPLEDGKLQTTPSEDIESYFNLCSLYYDNGIPAEKVMMTANESWLPASKTMSEHLPLVNDALDTEMEQDGMYVCPPVTSDNEEAIEPLSESMEKAGMLLFNLHGASRTGKSGFYHDGGEAFSTELLRYTNARVLNTVACYGARYHEYERDDSMMLTAMYSNGFLLYAGSLIPVPMTELDIPEGVEVHEGSGSEHLMPIYCMEQYAGLPAGEAMMRAKLEYFNTFRHFERDDFSLATMMMFSLYGNPLLRLQRSEEVLRKSEEMHVLPKLPQTKTVVSEPVCMKLTKRLIDNSLGSSTLLTDIRSTVDANLSAIHQTIQQNLYDTLGLEPRYLKHVDSFTIGNEKGYIYTYIDNAKQYGNKAIVEVDPNGKIRKIFKMK